MICSACGRAKFSGTANIAASSPRLASGSLPLGKANVEVEMIFTCQTCGQVQSGSQISVVVCHLDDMVMPYSKLLYEFVRKSYGDGWNIRHAGQRLNAEEQNNPSTKQGWADAQAHSDSRKGKAPPKGWGLEKSGKYLTTETACRHLKLLSLIELAT